MGLTNYKQRLFAKYYDKMAQAYDVAMHKEKSELLSTLNGVVVELGPGTGANLKLLPEGVQWVGIEPNKHMHPLLESKAKELGVPVDLRWLSAEQLPVDDGSADCVLSTLVLCSVPDVAGALAEVRRVLRPGGKFVFWEHVIAPEGLLMRGLQHALTPLQRFLADGCCCNRDFAKSLEAAGFSETRLEEFRIPKEVGPLWIRPHVRGVAIR